MIEVQNQTVNLGLACGLMSVAADGVVELTDKGERYLRAWIANKLGITPRWLYLYSSDTALD